MQPIKLKPRRNRTKLKARALAWKTEKAAEYEDTFEAASIRLLTGQSYAEFVYGERGIQPKGILDR